jgi:hypothetical protein
MPLKAFAKAQRKHVEKAVPPIIIPYVLHSISHFYCNTDCSVVFLVSNVSSMKKTIPMNPHLALDPILNSLLQEMTQMEKVRMLMVIVEGIPADSRLWR